MNRLEESDRPVVSKKRPNKAGRPAAEGVERRGLVKGNSLQRDMHRMQGRGRVRQALERIRQAAKREKGGKLTSLMHHIYSVDTLREAYYRLEREAAPGVDGITWRQYGEELETNLQDLSGRLARGAYRASPVQRVYVPKPDGRQRPIGVPALGIQKLWLWALQHRSQKAKRQCDWATLHAKPWFRLPSPRVTQ